MDSGAQLATLLTARTPVEAEVVKSILEAAGIPALLSGEYAADDLAISLQASGFVGVDVQVSSRRLEEARGLVEEALSGGRELEVQAAGGDDEDLEAGEEFEPEPEVENQA